MTAYRGTLHIDGHAFPVRVSTRADEPPSDPAEPRLRGEKLPTVTCSFLVKAEDLPGWLFWPKLTPAQHSMLTSTFRCIHMPELRGRPSVFPRGAWQHASIRALERKGFIEFFDWGCDIDGEVEQDVPLYRPTEDGIAYLIAHRAVTADDFQYVIKYAMRALCGSGAWVAPGAAFP